MNKTFCMIAEIGGTHIGNLDRAKYLTKLAKESGADVLKTQKRNPKESVKKELWDKPHPNSRFAYGDTYLKHRINLELNQNQHAELKKYCESINIEYSTSVWDMTSAREIIELNPKLIKIPSACNDNKEMINYLYDNYEGEIHISMGMTTLEERSHILKYYTNHRSRTVLYHCTSGYPVPFKDIHLKEITKLMRVVPSTHLGFSNHGYGIALEMAAYALGTRYFERHFIDDRAFPHTDSAPSVEPQGMKKLCRNLEAIEDAMQDKPDYVIALEMEQRNKLRS